MWKYFIVTITTILVASCATKEDLAPELASIESVKAIPTQFERLQDSPTCVVATPNYISINTNRSLANDYGITGDLDLYAIGSDEIDSDGSLTTPDYNGNGLFTIAFGSGNTIRTGVYFTARSGYVEPSGNRNRYVSISLTDRSPWSSPFPRLYVKSNQKVLVVVNESQTHARIKFCDVELDLKETSQNSGSIKGEVTVRIRS